MEIGRFGFGGGVGLPKLATAARRAAESAGCWTVVDMGAWAGGYGEGMRYVRVERDGDAGRAGWAKKARELAGGGLLSLDLLEGEPGVMCDHLAGSSRLRSTKYISFPEDCQNYFSNTNHKINVWQLTPLHRQGSEPVFSNSHVLLLFQTQTVTPTIPLKTNPAPPKQLHRKYPNRDDRSRLQRENVTRAALWKMYSSTHQAAAFLFRNHNGKNSL